ncbi:ferric reductase-like transmembrane domain-containing protein [Croceicoccus bisphenolivorans]|uniref:ferric reductase-like transmembrane domain-containing protein n=1 Tax=Croceicoccus bisphenolivorans TaxID=1783232 RepID=UPI00082E7733|nr:ferric reductase-like transmembrane domain-containing protein [Croceicoccus bisphenolivorans]
MAFWLALAVPATLMISALAQGELAMDLLHPSGELSLRLLVIALLPGPLIEFFGANRFLRGWLALRRNFGVAAFGYAALHLVFYGIDMGAIAPIIAEFTLPAIWTGWLGFALMLAAASISNDAAMAALGRRKWKRVQQGAYVALLFSLAHWVLLDWSWIPAVVHVAPVIIAWALRFVARARRKSSVKGTA